MHELADVHETPSNLLGFAPAGFGVGSILHVEPFHDSANVTCAPALSVYSPTAVHALGDGHETLVSLLRRASAGFGFGVGSILHVEPFHDSANVNCAPALSVYSPTAMHEFAEVHDTPSKLLWFSPAGFGVGSIVQPAPNAAVGPTKIEIEITTTNPNRQVAPRSDPAISDGDGANINGYRP